MSIQYELRQRTPLYVYVVDNNRQWNTFRKWLIRNGSDSDVYWRFPMGNNKYIIVSTMRKNGRAESNNDEIINNVPMWFDSRPEGANVSRSYSAPSRKKPRKYKTVTRPPRMPNRKVVVRNLGKESWRVKANNARALLLGRICDLTLEQWAETLERFGWKCVYCGREFEEMDHIIAIEDGGGTTKDNVAPSCKKCNRDKNFANRTKSMSTMAAIE